MFRLRMITGSTADEHRRDFPNKECDMDGNSLRIADHVADVEVDGAWVIVDTRKGRVYALNPSASFVWKQIRRGWDWRMAARVLARANGQSEGRVLRQVGKFIADLQEEGLLVTGATETTSVEPLSEDVPPAYLPPSVTLSLPLEARAGSSLPNTSDPDPLMDPLSPFRLGQDGQHR